MEFSQQSFVTLEVTELTGVEAEPWMYHYGREVESKSNFKNDKAVTSLNLFSLLVSFLLFYFCQGESLETIPISNIYQISRDALQTKLPRFIFSLLTYKSMSFSFLLVTV